MLKFIQLADDIESDLKSLDTAADDLQHRRSRAKERADRVINDHHRIQDRIDDGLAAMERVSQAAGLPNTGQRTTAELAAIEKEEQEQLAKLNGEEQVIGATEVGDAGPLIEPPAPEAPKLGEASGDTPSDAGFPKSA